MQLVYVAIREAQRIDDGAWQEWPHICGSHLAASYCICRLRRFRVGSDAVWRARRRLERCGVHNAL